MLIRTPLQCTHLCGVDDYEDIVTLFELFNHWISSLEEYHIYMDYMVATLEPTISEVQLLAFTCIYRLNFNMCTLQPVLVGVHLNLYV